MAAIGAPDPRQVETALRRHPAMFRVLYQPVSRSDRFAYQAHVDGTAKQLAIGLVGVALLVFSQSPSFNALNLFYALVPILGLWMVVVFMVHKDYRTRLMGNLTEQIGSTVTNW